MFGLFSHEQGRSSGKYADGLSQGRKCAGTAQTPCMVDGIRLFKASFNSRPKFQHHGRLLVAGLQTVNVRSTELERYQGEFVRRGGIEGAAGCSTCSGIGLALGTGSNCR